MSIEELKMENAMLKEKLWSICKIYPVLRKVLKFLKVFSFIKPGAKVIIEGAIEVLDGVCEIESAGEYQRPA